MPSSKIWELSLRKTEKKTSVQNNPNLVKSVSRQSEPTTRTGLPNKKQGRSLKTPQSCTNRQEGIQPVPQVLPADTNTQTHNLSVQTSYQKTKHLLAQPETIVFSKEKSIQPVHKVLQTGIKQERISIATDRTSTSSQTSLSPNTAKNTNTQVSQNIQRRKLKPQHTMSESTTTSTSESVQLTPQLKPQCIASDYQQPGASSKNKEVNQAEAGAMPCDYFYQLVETASLHCKMAAVPKINKYQVNPLRADSEKPPLTNTIVVPGRPNKAFFTQVKECAPNGYTVKRTRYLENETNIYFNDLQDKDNVLEFLKSNNMSYYTFTNTYTYTDRDTYTQTCGYILHGLFASYLVDEILHELQELIDGVISVYRMNHRRDNIYETNYCPINYLVITENTVTLADICKIRVIDHVRVTWSRHEKRKQIIQCHRCQRWGHATSDCNMPPRCLKCAQGHHTRTCIKSPNTPAQCVNCGGDHPANNVICSVYKELLLEINQSQTKAAAPQQLENYTPIEPLTREDWDLRSYRQFPDLSESDSLYSTQSINQPVLPTQQSLEAPPAYTNLQQYGNSSSYRSSDLDSAMRKLDSLINFTEMVRAVQDLTAVAAQASSEPDIFIAVLTFLVRDLNNYNISNHNRAA